MRWQLRILPIFVVVSLLAIGWDGLRDALFPSGTTPALAFVMAGIFQLWEELVRIKIFLGVEGE